LPTMNDASTYEVVIGLEVHAQLLTRSKLFCGDPTAFGAEPNTQVSAISLGHPGTLPRLNREAVAMAIKLGLACNCGITRNNYFARKNYFYPDLPKGYQISQHTTPICRDGWLEVDVNGETKKIRLNRIHIEEDAGKSMHDPSSGFSNIDYNRAGMPLVEIVTEPDIRSADEAFAYVTELRKLVRHLGVCDGNMEQGSLRCDVNISVRPLGETALGTKVEIKNLNSIRFIKKAIESESRRLIGLHRKGEPILQQTRGLDENSFTTFAIRTKEDEDDYRYFPEPDLPPFTVTEEFIEAIRQQLPPSTAEIKKELSARYALSDYDAAQLAGNPVLMDYFTALAAETANYKAAANWTIGPVKNWLQQDEREEFPAPAASVALLIRLIDEGRLSYGIAVQKVLPQLINNPQTDVQEYIAGNDLYLQGLPDGPDKHIEEALKKYADKIPEYKKGKKGLISLFVGEVMKLSKGKADAKMVTEKLIEKLKN
jgi:aspartyl-tRNA(Asn)/glutamyl-tRNA(Gln) amidotransferase subunit B